MKVGQDIIKFVENIDSYSNHRLRNKEDLCILLHMSRSEGKDQVFDDLTSHAKCVYRLAGILKRTTPNSAAYPQLKAEFGDGVEKVHTLIRTLVKEASDDVKQHFISKYFTMTHSSLENLLSISHDLSWVKNWNVDHSKNL